MFVGLTLPNASTKLLSDLAVTSSGKLVTFTNFGSFAVFSSTALNKKYIQNTTRG